MCDYDIAIFIFFRHSSYTFSQKLIMLRLTFYMHQYTVFDQFKQKLLEGQHDKGDKGSSPIALSAFSAFVLGAVSKSIATFITYPAIRYVIYLSTLLQF